MPRPADPDAPMFHPRGLVRRVHGHPSALAGGIRALLIQALHPLAMAAVADHTDPREEAWRRIERTRDYVRVVTFGTRAQALAAARHVNSIHRRVTGVDQVTGHPYRADDPELLLWVHSVLVDSELVAYQRFGPGLSRRAEDRYVSEMIVAAALVGIPAVSVPRTAAANRRYLAQVPGLRVTAAARDGVRMLLRPPHRPLAFPIWGVGLAAAVSLLPDEVRRAYGIHWSPVADAAVDLAMVGLTWAALHVLPEPRLPNVRVA
ncbi:MAG: oxygenase MpaB family protein [Candidatus Dormibacteraceae bacterium]